MNIITLAIIQFPRRLGELQSNLTQARKYAYQIKNADIVLLPEDWLGTSLMSWKDFLNASLEIKELLPRDCLLVAGAGFVRTGQMSVSRGAFIYKKSPVIIPYEKQFPSHAIGERKFIQKGKLLPVIEYKGIKMGVSVCVDLFYPEVVRNLALRGAEIIFNPANIPDSRMDLWQWLGAARAAENTVYVAMANNTLTSYRDGRRVAGRSFVARPDGHGLQQCGNDPGIYYFRLNMDLIKKVRKRWRYLDDIRENRENILNFYLSH